MTIQIKMDFVFYIRCFDFTMTIGYHMLNSFKALSMNSCGRVVKRCRRSRQRYSTLSELLMWGAFNELKQTEQTAKEI